MWFDAYYAEFPDDLPAGMREKILDFIARGDDAFCTASRDDARMIDLIMAQYYWEFCFQGNRHPAIDISPSAHKACRYACELSDVLPGASSIAQDYYRSVFRGRSLARCEGHTYESDDGVFELSWLLPAEVSAFLAELEGFESELNGQEDWSAGVLWVLTTLKKAKRKGTSLIVIRA